MPRVYVRKRETKYSLEDLQKAVKDVEENKKTYRQAEQEYNVPISVIYHRIKGRKIDINRMGAGVNKVLPDRVEKHIVNCLKIRAEMGHPVLKEELKMLVKNYIEIKKLPNPFKDNKPGDDWYLYFMKRNSDLSFKKPEHLQKLRKDARKPYIVYNFYDLLSSVIEKNDLKNKPMYIYNCDESGFQSDPTKLRAIGEKGKALHRVSGGSGRESTTVLACVSADGKALPPLIVFKGAAVQARWTSEKTYPGTLYGATKNGWMEESVFFNWLIKSFVSHVNKIRADRNEPDQKALLIYDGHSSHISVRITEKADEENIILLKFPSHLTDRIQPLDKCVFGPMKKAWDKKLIEYGVKQMGKGIGRLSRSQFGELLGEVYGNALKPQNVISGFTTTGLFPVNPNKFPKNIFNAEDMTLYNSILKDQSDREQASEIDLDQLDMERYCREDQHTNRYQIKPQKQVQTVTENIVKEHVAQDTAEFEQISIEEIETEEVEMQFEEIEEIDQLTNLKELQENNLIEKKLMLIEEKNEKKTENFKKVVPKIQSEEIEQIPTEQIETEQVIEKIDQVTNTKELQENNLIVKNTCIDRREKQKEVIRQKESEEIVQIPIELEIAKLSSPLLNNIMKTISLDTSTNNETKLKILNAMFGSVLNYKEKDLVENNSPNKVAIQKIFGIEATPEKKKKIVIPRLKQCAFGEILTSDEVKQRLKLAEEKKVKAIGKKKVTNTKQRPVLEDSTCKENDTIENHKQTKGKGQGKKTKETKAKSMLNKKRKLQSDCNTNSDSVIANVVLNNTDNTHKNIDNKQKKQKRETAKAKKKNERKNKTLNKRRKVESDDSNSEIDMSCHSDSDLADVVSDEDMANSVSDIADNGSDKVHIESETTAGCSKEEKEITTDYNIDENILVRYFKNKTVKYYVGTILEKSINDYTVSFLKKLGRNDSTRFVITKNKDIDTVLPSAIVKKVDLLAYNENRTEFIFLEDDDLVYFD